MAAKYVGYSSDKGWILQAKELFNGIIIDSVSKKFLIFFPLIWLKIFFVINLDIIKIQILFTLMKEHIKNLAGITSVLSLLIKRGSFFISFLCKIYI